LIGAENDHVRIYDIHSGQCYIPTDSKTKGHVGTINMVQYGPSGNVFASCGEDGNIVLWDGTTGKLIRTISTAHGGAPVSSISFTKNGKHILSTGLDSVRRLWDVTSGRTVLNYEGASQKVEYKERLTSC
jgi:cleavage stimulation factor subunit 1